MTRSSVARHTEKVQAAIETDDAAKSALIASWRRSSTLHHLDPAEHKPPQRLTDQELCLARQKIEPLIGIAQASLDRLHLAVGGTGCCVLLADRDGIPVERRGANSDDKTFRDWGLWPGTVWSEECEGTNGIGTCLIEQRLLTIDRDQHFYTRNTLLSCTTAPIFDCEGSLVAALDVSSCRADLTEGFVTLISIAVGDAARRIEAANFQRAYPAARIVVAPTASSTSNTLLAIDKDDWVVGATRSARMAFGITNDMLAKPLPASDLLRLETGEAGELGQAERTILKRALIRSNGNVTAAARNLGMSRATLYRKLLRHGVRAAH
jgi:transcriptional regulator of acetoin/glycerol metabolism